MAIKKGDKPTMFSDANVLGVKKHNSLLQEKEEVLTPAPEEKKAEEISQPKKDNINVEDVIIKSKDKKDKAKTKTKAKSKEEPIVEEKDELKETNEIQGDSPIQLFLKNQNMDKKKYVTFFMRESTIALISEFAGKGAGKDRTGYDKSEFVDLLLTQAINALKLKEQK